MTTTLNTTFAEWVGGMPVGWTQFTDSVGVDTDTVHITNSAGAALVCDQQTVGIVSTPVSAGTYQATVNVANGAVALLALDSYGRSPLFNHTRGVDNWVLPHSGQMSTATVIGDIFTTHNGDTLELIDAASSGELSSEGAIYARRNAGEPFLYFDTPTRNECLFPGIVHLPEKDVLVIMEQVGYDVDITATDLDADGIPIMGTRRVLLAETDMFFEMSTCIVHSDGNVYAFALRCPAANGLTFTGASMRAYRSSDGLQTFVPVAPAIDVSPSAGWVRAFSESYTVELSDGKIRSFHRNGNGYIAYTTVDPVANTHTGVFQTNIRTPQAAPYAKNLSDGRIALCWHGCNPDSGGYTPRKVLCIAFSDDDCATWSNVHLLASSSSLGDSMSGDLPQVNQPMIREHNGELSVAYSRILADEGSSMIGYIATATGDVLYGDNVSSGVGEQTISVTVPEGSRLALVSMFGGATFTAKAITPVNTIGAIDFNLSMPPVQVDGAIDFNLQLPIITSNAIDFNIIMPSDVRTASTWTKEDFDEYAPHWSEDEAAVKAWTT